MDPADAEGCGVLKKKKRLSLEQLDGYFLEL